MWSRLPLRRGLRGPRLTTCPTGLLTGVAFAEDLNGRRHLLLADPLVLLALGGRFEALPGQGAQVEVHEHVAQALQVISTALLCRVKDKVRGRVHLGSQLTGARTPFSRACSSIEGNNPHCAPSTSPPLSHAGLLQPHYKQALLSPPSTEKGPEAELFQHNLGLVFPAQALIHSATMQ